MNDLNELKKCVEVLNKTGDLKPEHADRLLLHINNIEKLLGTDSDKEALIGGVKTIEGIVHACRLPSYSDLIFTLIMCLYHREDHFKILKVINRASVVAPENSIHRKSDRTIYID